MTWLSARASFFGRNVTLVCAGSGWGHTNIEALGEFVATDSDGACAMILFR